MRQATRPAPCSVCSQLHRPKYLTSLEGLSPAAFQGFVQESYPHLKPQAQLCLSCVSALRSDYITESLSREKGELLQLERNVVESLHEEALKLQQLDAIDEHLTLGQRIADKVAEFGGSWAFIISFGVVLGIWIMTNSLLHKPFDPYPFILLNLMLSCVAALQAPVIMMSQNRAEARDRPRAENDYRTNLLAELEIRQLHQKLDHLLQNQWQRLLEIQQLQTELMHEIMDRKTSRSGKGKLIDLP